MQVLPTAFLILLSLTVALLLPGPSRPCRRLTCLVTPRRLVLTMSITLALLGVWCFFTLLDFPLPTSVKHQSKIIEAVKDNSDINQT